MPWAPDTANWSLKSQTKPLSCKSLATVGTIANPYHWAMSCKLVQLEQYDSTVSIHVNAHVKPSQITDTAWANFYWFYAINIGYETN